MMALGTVVGHGVLEKRLSCVLTFLLELLTHAVGSDVGVHQGLLPGSDWLLYGALGGVQAPPESSRPPPHFSISQSCEEALPGMVLTNVIAGVVSHFLHLDWFRPVQFARLPTVNR